MADPDITVASAEVTVSSGIGSSSALMMKDAYLAEAGEETDGEFSPFRPEPRDSPGEELSGPGVMVSVTRITGRTPDGVANQTGTPGSRPDPGSPGVYTEVFLLRLHLSDPLTTRFINGSIDVTFGSGSTILAHSPSERGTVTALIEAGRDALSLSQDLVMQGATTVSPSPDVPAGHRLALPAGRGESVAGTYSRETGYRFAIPAGLLLEYRGIPRNRNAIFWEIYPPMPPQDTERSGHGMMAVFSCIVRAGATPPGVTIGFEGRVKGKLWGVVPVKGTVVFS